jgi:hypothetical protein
MGLLYVICKVAIKHCSTRDETGSETVISQLSQQVMIASSKIPLEWFDEYSTPFDSPGRQNIQEILCDDTVDDESKDIVISENTARAIKGEVEFAFLGEVYTSTEEIKAVICDGGETSMPSSSFENCTDCQPKIVEIKTAEGGVVMATAHVCMMT